MTRATKAWALLVALSAASTALAASGLSGAALALPILIAGLKAHVILRDYLGLFVAPGWLRGFDLGLTLLILAFAGLSLAA
jgi:hypothetical protein